MKAALLQGAKDLRHKNRVRNYRRLSSIGKRGSFKKNKLPGERVLQNRKNNLANGIPVLKKVWDKIMEL